MLLPRSGCPPPQPPTRRVFPARSADRPLPPMRGVSPKLVRRISYSPSSNPHQLPPISNPQPIMASSSSSSSCAVHKVALAGFASGTNDHYDKSRPSYPLEAVQHIHDAVSSVQGGLNVVELGAGTVGPFLPQPATPGPRPDVDGLTASLPLLERQGIFSRLLLAPPEGFPTFDFKSFIATDPSEGMVRGPAPSHLPASWP